MSTLAATELDADALHWRPRIATSTCRRPVVPTAAVPRPVALERLAATRPGDVVVVTAPAGYGKTITLGLWDDADPRPFAWACLDRLDNDPVHLVVHIATALADSVGLDPSVLRYLNGPGREPVGELVPALVASLEDVPGAVVVLDDVHLLDDPESLECVSYLVRTTSELTTVVLSGRGTPPVPLARHRLEGRVVEVGTADLRLTPTEAAQVFEAAGSTDDDATIAAVVDRCEGWAGGVHLAALALRNAPGTAGDELLSGRHRLVADYLVEEVLARLDPATTDFLEESSVLARFSAEHLDAVLQRRDSARRLAEIEASGNLFLVPLDEERRWYRYHHLFADLLRARLRTRDTERFRELASQASIVLERDGDIDAAIAQAVDAGDTDRAAALVVRDAVPLAFGGHATVLTRRVSMLDPEVLDRSPSAAIARAWLGVATGDGEVILSSLNAAHLADDGRPLADGTVSVRVATSLIAAMISVGGIHQLVANCDVVLAAGDVSTNPLWGVASTIKGTALANLDRTVEARRLLTDAIPAVSHIPGMVAACHAYLAGLDLDDGDLVGAGRHIDTARALVDDHDLSDVVPVMVVYATDAVIAARRNQRERAIDASRTAITLLDRLGNLAARTALVGSVLLTRAALALNDGASARRHLAEARRAREREPDALGLNRQLEEIEAQLDAGAMTSLLTPLTAAELRVLPYLATHLSLMEIADRLVLSRNTVKSHSVAIYRKLGVSSRSDAVNHARRLGLLGD